MLPPTQTHAITPLDYYIRLTNPELWKIQLTHLRTEYPPTTDGISDGYTEWTATVNDAPVSIACYWRFRENNVISTRPIDILTNLMMLDDKGYDAGPIKTGEVLLDVLGTRWLNQKCQTKQVVDPPPAVSDGRLQ